MIDISIITVNYNNRDGLEKTINSVLNQTFTNYEFIIIDGNSKDGSKELIDRNSDKISYWVSEEDSGIYNAMNKGIRKSTGNYLLFLNSGDSLHSSVSLNEVHVILNSAIDIYYGDIEYSEGGIKTKRFFPEKLTFSFFLEHSISHQASFIKKTLFDKFFYYNEDHEIISDWEFFIYAICKRNARTYKINQIITDYDTSGLSSNLANHDKMHRERAAVIEKHFPAFIDDYKNIKFLESKRGKQIMQVSKHSLLWRLLKGYLGILMLFLPKVKSKNG
ncbi:MAG: glycosyltransferase family 2 protein [Bacteroidota bacterium]